MDDVYFGVLRLWHLLTSSKKALVAIVGVVAVVATVTTVVAAPTQDDSEDMASPAEVSPVVESSVSESVDVLTVGDVSSPGLLPTSPFYPLKVVMREVALAFTFDPVSKANRCLRYANEDLLAIHHLYDKSEVHASEQCLGYQEHFWNSILWIAKAGTEGHNVVGALGSIRSAHDTHRVALTDVLSAVDTNGAVAGYSTISPMRQAVIEAAASTSAELEFAILAWQGQSEATRFHAKLQNDFSLVNREVWLQIENCLGMPAEQAMALTSAIGDEGTGAVSGMPIITSMHVDKFRIEPGDSCTVTCNATDFQSDAITYQWLAANGDIQGDGAIVTWTAPEDIGEYRISVVVSDSSGNQSSKAVTVVVGDPPEEAEEDDGGSGGPFRIEGVEVEPMGHDLLKSPALGTTQWTIFRGREVQISCIMDGDTSGLDYEWSCDVGSIEDEDGDTAVWEAPGHPCYAQVTVVAEGGNGDREEETITFRVSTCSTCF